MWPEENLQPTPQEVPKAEPAAKLTMNALTPGPSPSGRGELNALVPYSQWARGRQDLRCPHPFGGRYGPCKGRRGRQVAAPIAQGNPPVPTAQGNAPAPIIVTATSNGLIIRSDDLDALDEFEKLLQDTWNNLGNEPLTIYYIKYAKADVVASELDRLLTGGSGDAEGSDAGGAAGKGKAMATGTVKIIPELRLNALMVTANRTDKATIKRLLETVLDRQGPPDDPAISRKSHMLPVEHAKARDIAEELREVYADQLVLTQGQQNRANFAGGGGPLAMMMGGMMGGGMMGGGPGGGRGGRDGGGGGGGSSRADEANRISIGVDNRTNTLIISATDAKFEEVKQLVRGARRGGGRATRNHTVRPVAPHQPERPSRNT